MNSKSMPLKVGMNLMGIHPTVRHIELPALVSFSSFDEVMMAYTWMFKDLDPSEEAALATFLKSRIIEQGEQFRLRHEPEPKSNHQRPRPRWRVCAKSRPSPSSS